MLHIRQIQLVQFKNYSSATFPFTARVIGICGANGIGKTNLLDAIYYLCFTKSYFNSSDQMNVQQGMLGMRIAANLTVNEQPTVITAIIRENGKKEITCDGEVYKKLAQHIGKFPAVMIAPDDIAIINETSDLRRKWLDTLISQINPTYLLQLIQYNKLLQQRNSLLKHAAERGVLNNDVLEILDHQIAPLADAIYGTRKQLLQRLIPAIGEQYQHIAGAAAEPISLSYESHLHTQNMSSLLLQNKQRDTYMQRTGSGIHKDDIGIHMHGQLFKQMASQGQKKSMLFAIKLAEYNLLQQQKGFAPILLLDDVFEKLDATRMQQLLHTVCIQHQGQVFITDTHSERLLQHLQTIDITPQIITLA
jgi:DNA replication and repair protein RecF